MNRMFFFLFSLIQHTHFYVKNIYIASKCDNKMNIIRVECANVNEKLLPICARKRFLFLYVEFCIMCIYGIKIKCVALKQITGSVFIKKKPYKWILGSFVWCTHTHTHTCAAYYKKGYTCRQRITQIYRSYVMPIFWYICATYSSTLLAKFQAFFCSLCDDDDDNVQPIRISWIYIIVCCIAFVHKVRR